MKRNPDYSPENEDERLIDQAMRHVGRDAQRAFVDLATRNLSVDVVTSLAKKQRQRKLFAQVSLIAAASGAAVVLFMIDLPMTEPIGVRQTNNAVSAVVESDAATLATEYLADISDEQAIDRIIEATDSEVMLLTHDDIDHLMEGLTNE